MVDIFDSDIEHISYLLHSYCIIHADECIVYIIASVTGIGGFGKADAREVIRNKLFGGMDNENVVATLIPIIVVCLSVHMKNEKPSDRDNYRFKCFVTRKHSIHYV